MIWVDYIITGLLALSVIVGIFKGFAKQAYSLLAWCSAIVVGIFFSHDFTWLIQGYISDPLARLAAAFAALNLITLIVTGLVGILLGIVLTSKRLSVLDRLGGMVLGAAHGALFMIIALLLTGLSALPKSPWWQQSKLIPPFQTASAWLSLHLPSDFTKKIHYH